MLWTDLHNKLRDKKKQIEPSLNTTTTTLLIKERRRVRSSAAKTYNTRAENYDVARTFMQKFIGQKVLFLIKDHSIVQLTILFYYINQTYLYIIIKSEMLEYNQLQQLLYSMINFDQLINTW